MLHLLARHTSDKLYKKTHQLVLDTIVDITIIEALA